MKLSIPMETMIKEAAFHEVRQNGIVVRSGYVIAGKSNTVVALISRKLATTSDAENFGLNWLTEDGEDVYRGFANIVIDEHSAAMGPDLGDDVASSIDDDVTATNELPGDAELAAYADEDAATYAEILAEQDTDEEWVTRLIQTLDAYVYTSKKIFVSKINYINVMRRVRAERVARDVAVNMLRADMVPWMDDMFAGLDDMVTDGRKTWQAVDKAKRRIRQMTRPSIGPKRKRSKSRGATKAVRSR